MQALCSHHPTSCVPTCFVWVSGLSLGCFVLFAAVVPQQGFQRKCSARVWPLKVRRWGVGGRGRSAPPQRTHKLRKNSKCFPPMPPTPDLPIPNFTPEWHKRHAKLQLLLPALKFALETQAASWICSFPPSLSLLPALATHHQHNCIIRPHATVQGLGNWPLHQRAESQETTKPRGHGTNCQKQKA